MQSKTRPTRKHIAGRKLISNGPMAKVARALGISRNAVARKLGVPHGTVQTWDIRGEVPEEFKSKVAKLAGKATRKAA